MARKIEEFRVQMREKEEKFYKLKQLEINDFRVNTKTKLKINVDKLSGLGYFSEREK